MNQCDDLLPDFDLLLVPEGETVNCILAKHEYGTEHLSRLPNGRLIKWILECAEAADGEICTEEYCEDFVYYYVDEVENSV